ncbi:hypothetical protein EYF80_039590 [Liparis tanakae]|uniref:Uncharacterized protein n=1 Tax=Liparis tanakae TaxID=230148 RepID=A0A4Z2G9M2_9TELE|nr:hypothetical protein EYF80_039590 [Liparis tanakae]
MVTWIFPTRKAGWTVGRHAGFKKKKKKNLFLGDLDQPPPEPRQVFPTLGKPNPVHQTVARLQGHLMRQEEQEDRFPVGFTGVGPSAAVTLFLPDCPDEPTRCWELGAGNDWVGMFNMSATLRRQLPSRRKPIRPTAV